MNTKFSFGGIPSPTDYRDQYANMAAMSAAVDISLPDTFHTDLGNDMDQNIEPACVSHSITYLIRRWWFEKHGEWVDFSPRFLDILSAENWIPLEGGRVPRTVFKIAANIGICTTNTLPNDTSLSIGQYRDKNAITPAAYAEALKYRIPGFTFIATDPLSTRKGIYMYSALSSLYMVGEELWKPSRKPRDTDPLRTPGKIISGHEMTPCGWKDGKLNTLRNQWGLDWARKDETYYDPIAWQPYTSEQWVIADIPQDLVLFLKSLPSPSSFHYNFQTTLLQGMVNEEVKELQVALMILGLLPIVSKDELGIYGSKTAAAVGKFQAMNKINPVPGNVGPLTRGALNKQFSL